MNLLQIGGMDLLAGAFLPARASRIRFGARVTTIEPAEDGGSIRYQAIGDPRQATATLRSHDEGFADAARRRVDFRVSGSR